MSLAGEFRRLYDSGDLEIPLPGGGHTADRHRCLHELGRRDLSLARLAEAHTDAVAILNEAGRVPARGCLYGVWAAETRSHPMRLEGTAKGFRLTGSKVFCSGAGIVDRALVTVVDPEHLVVDVDLRAAADAVRCDASGWIATAFAETMTSTVMFYGAPVSEAEIIGGPGWYLSRPGFWHGACGPAACWAGGAAGLVDYACSQPQEDAHTMAHRGAMSALSWGMRACLDSAGREIDVAPLDSEAAVSRALMLRHVIDQACSDILRRFLRAYGPRPIAFNAGVSRRYQEVELYIRQCHAERDLEVLGRRGPGAQE